MFNVFGCCKTSTIDQGIIETKCNNEDLFIFLTYQQDNVHVENYCVWLATCRIVRSVDESLANVLLKLHHANRPAYERLYIFNRLEVALVI